jgi:transposase
MVWGADGKGQAAAERFFDALDPADPENAGPQTVGVQASQLTAVSMDMTGGYAAAVRSRAPQAEIVIDNYHVVALATRALDEVRRAHCNELRTGGQIAAAVQLKQDRWALVKNPDQLTDAQAQTLSIIQAVGGKVARAWAMKEMV